MIIEGGLDSVSQCAGCGRDPVAVPFEISCGTQVLQTVVKEDDVVTLPDPGLGAEDLVSGNVGFKNTTRDGSIHNDIKEVHQAHGVKNREAMVGR